MRSFLLVLLLAACNPPAQDPSLAPIDAYDPLPFVDPFIATGGVGVQIANANPGAAVPFGLVLAGPDTRNSAYGAPSFYHCAGYHYEDDEIDGFSHLHSHGMGVTDFAGALVMPRADWDPADTTDQGRAAPFDHAEEQASPGYYAVTLQDDGTRVEIAATRRGAIHHYTFAPGHQPIVLLDLGHALDGDHVDSSWIDIEGSEVTGYQNLLGGYSGRFGGLQIHVAATVDPAPVAAGTWTAPSDPQQGVTQASGTGVGGWVVFPQGTTEVTLRLAVSYVDVDGAVADRQAELDGKSFDDVHTAAEQAWRDLLSKVRVRGGSASDRRIFYTALYHTMLMPNIQTDVDGRYRGLDGQVHTADFDYYSNFSLWDTFRTLHGWYALVFPDRQRDMVRSLVRMSEDGGELPKWPLAHGYTDGMVGTPEDEVLAQTALDGIGGWDQEEAFAAALRHATGSVPHGRAGIDDYRTLGWVPIEDTSGSASRTLEDAWSDDALSRWATALGRTDDAQALLGQSHAWKNLWDPDAGFFRGRHADGSFDPWHPGDDAAWSDVYTEGDAWHYLWYVPYDVPGMIQVQDGGDRAAFLDRLSTYWQDVYAQPDDLLPGTYYWHGNEPVMHDAYVAALAGDPDLTDEAARWILTHRYDDQPDGLDGNDDSGTLSAWYLLSSIGLFPIGGTPEYVVGSPIWERVEIDRPDGTLIIRAPGASWDDPYVQSAVLGAAALDSPAVSYQDLVGAGDLILTMGPTGGAWKPAAQ